MQQIKEMKLDYSVQLETIHIRDHLDPFFSSSPDIC
jgi:hypothetical protein